MIKNECDIPAFPAILNSIAKSKHIPLSAQFELTARCNFNCRMCYIHMDEQRINTLGKELTTDEWLRIAKEAKEAGTLYLTLTGGEVFTRPDFQELYEKLSEMGFLITIMTNASLIDEKVINWLQEKPPFAIRVTLYGSNNEIYYSVCRVKNGFTAIDNALELLQKANVPISLKSVIIKNNVSDVVEMYRYAAKRSLHLQIVKGIVKPVRGAISEAANVRIEPWLEEYMKSDFSKVQAKKDGRGPYQHHPVYMDDCRLYGHSFNVTWDGHMVLCSFMDEPYFDLHAYSVSDAWKRFIDKISLIERPEPCVNCLYEEYCTRCPGSLNAECGSYNKVSESYCQTAKRLYCLYNPEKTKEIIL